MHVILSDLLWYLIVGSIPLLHASITCLTICFTLKTALVYNTLIILHVPSLNTVKILLMRSVENFQIYVCTYTSISPDCLLDCWPAIRPTSTRSMAPDFSHIVSNLKNCCSNEDSSTAP